MSKSIRGCALLLLGTIMYLGFNFNSKQTDPITKSDAEGYYIYLPALFINHGFSDLEPISNHEYDRYPGTTQVYTRYSYGVAFLQTPFFLLADALTRISDYRRDGFSQIYIYGLVVSGVFYACLGLFFLYHSLLEEVDPWIAFLTCFVTFGGTNLYYYTIAEMGMSHVYSFCLFACFIYLVPRLYRDNRIIHYVMLALVLGLIVLIRPTNLILSLYLLGYGIQDRHDVYGRFRFILDNFWRWMLFPVFGFCWLIPQFYYWYYLSGEFLLYTYHNQGFSNWNRPQILNVLFSVQNGLYAYSPVVLLSTVGLFVIGYTNQWQGRV